MRKVVKNVVFLGTSKSDLSSMPNLVKLSFGHGLHEAQEGRYPLNAKTLSGFGSANVIELKQTTASGTYRAVYTVQFKNTIYVLHCFKKKSNSGIATPKPDIDLIKKRLKIAIETEQSNNEVMKNEK